MPDFQLAPWSTIQGVGAASGILLLQDALFIVSDSSSFLYRYCLQAPHLQKIPLLPDAQDHIEKKFKLDLESICLKDRTLYLFGSGSTPRRQIMFSYHLDSQQVQQVDLSALYAQFRQLAGLADDELNIEGVVYHAGAATARWIFLQRGNGLNARNGLFVLHAELIDVVEQGLLEQGQVSFTPLQLPFIGTVESSFTDGCVHGDTLYFLAAAEDTTSTYDDGEVLGSLIGSIDLHTLQLVTYQQITALHKFEGLSLQVAKAGQVAFLLCEDNDTAVLQSTIYQLVWQP